MIGKWLPRPDAAASFTRLQLSPAVLPGLCVLLLSAAFVRIGSLLVPALSGDEQWVGIEALNILKGIFPPFIYGTPYQGSLGLYLQALSISLTGATPWALRFVPMLYGLLGIVLTFLLARRLFDREAAWIAALVAAFPGDAFLAESMKAQYYYSLTPVLGTLVLLVGLAAWRHRGPAGATRWFVFGLLSGIAFWTNYSCVIYPAAIGIPLVVTDFRRALADGLRYVLPGYLLGTLPLWLYNLEAAVLFVAPAGPLWDDWRSYLPHMVAYFRQIFEKMGATFPGDARWAALHGPHALLLAGLFLAGLAASAVRVRREAAIAVIPLVAVGHMVPIMASRFGEDVPLRYLMPLQTVIPLVCGAGFALVRRWSRALAWGVMGVLVVANIWAAGLNLVTLPAEVRRVLDGWTADRHLLRHLGDLGLRTVYVGLPGLGLGFTSGGAVTFSRAWQDWNIVAAEAVDSSETVAFVHDGRFDDLEAGLEALNARYEVDRLGRWWVYRGIALSPPVTYDEIQPDTWSALADDNSQQAGAAFDRDLETAWTGPREAGRGYILDLGRPETVAMIAWLPRVYYESPTGIGVDVSLDGGTWSRVAHVPNYGNPVYWSGTHPFLRLRRSRIEVRFRAARARFIRLSPLRTDERFEWSMRELFVYRPTATPVTPDPGSIDQVARILARRHVEAIYGDHWVLARLRAVSRGTLPVLPVELFIDLHGRSDLYRGLVINPASPEARTAAEGRQVYDHPDLLRVKDTTVVVLQQSSGTMPAFETLLRESGYSFQSETVGDYAVYSAFVGPALPRHAVPSVGWVARAAPAGGAAQQAIDGRRESRWSTGRPQQPGDWFALDFGRVEQFSAIELDTHDAPAETGQRLELAVSTDGVHWVPLAARVVRVGRLAWGGTHALHWGVRATWLTFPAVAARFLTLHQNARGAHPWTIQEVRLYRAN